MCSTPCEDEYSRINGVTFSVVGEGLRTYVYRGECAYVVSVWVVLCNLKKNVHGSNRQRWLLV